MPHVIVATTSPDIKAEVIAASVAEHSDLILHEDRVVPVAEIDAAIESIGTSAEFALVLVGRESDTLLTQHYLEQQPNIVVLQVDIPGDLVSISIRDPQLEELVTALHALIAQHDRQTDHRVAQVQLRSMGRNVPGDADGYEDSSEFGKNEIAPAHAASPLFASAVAWIHDVLRHATAKVSDENGDAFGYALTRDTLLNVLDQREVGHGGQVAVAALKEQLTTNPQDDPLAAIVRVCKLTFLEFQLLLLALAPELDARYQRCIGFLQDDLSRRIGTLGFYCGLLGDSPLVRTEVAASGSLWRWRLFESPTVGADEPIRLDGCLVRWLFGEHDALLDEPVSRRVVRFRQWPGSLVLNGGEQRAAEELVSRLCDDTSSPWLLLGGDDPAGWQALLELGATRNGRKLVRVEASRLQAIDETELAECARQVARAVLLNQQVLAIDAADSSGQDESGSRLGDFLSMLSEAGCVAAVITRDHASVIRHAGDVSFDAARTQPISAEGKIAAVKVAAKSTGAALSDKGAETIVFRYPLTMDGLEQAAQLAMIRTIEDDSNERLVDRFTSCCRELAVEGISHLAQQIEPVFRLEDVVLPSNKKSQLSEIINHVKLASKVLDDWNFRDQLPYGRGVSALFFGDSGTGKTMSALAIANALGVSLLRVDLSRVVSKYIGDTEKNIDRVLADAQRSGAAILLDEAESLLGKRSVTKDAHDRYANIEVAYLLQRMEAFEGLAIMTTNMRHNIDDAFLRRLRFVLEFPRPDDDARERIWRYCLPNGTHEIDDAAFRQLARKIKLTGGHIRQISLRAAFSAAAADEPIHLEHIAHASCAEYAKLGMPPADLDLEKRAA